MSTREQFVAQDWLDFLPTADRFDALWNLTAERVDEPNRERGGWSEVVYTTLHNTQGEARTVYIKRQQDYLTRNLLHPFGELTVMRELHNIQLYNRLQVPALAAVYCAEQTSAQSRRGILITVALDDFVPFDSFHAQPLIGFKRRRGLLRAVGAAVRRLHHAGLEHHNLYPKHVFVRENTATTDNAGSTWDVRFIDLETTRHHRLFGWNGYRELETLDRRSTGWSRSERLVALLAYTNTRRVNKVVRECLRYLQQRRSRKETFIKEPRR